MALMIFHTDRTGFFPFEKNEVIENWMSTRGTESAQLIHRCDSYRMTLKMRPNADFSSKGLTTLIAFELLLLKVGKDSKMN